MEAFDEVLASRVGQTVGGRWTLRHLLGAGGMAAVYAAEDPEGRRAAIKLLHPEMGIRRDIRERFLLEAEVMTRINHPGMVTIYERGTDANTAYLAMELLEGEVIADRARRIGKVSPSEVLSLLDQVLDVLIAAHAQGVIHRDLKPENLFLTKEGRIKVLDFGLARLLDDGPTSFRTRTGAALGTLPYMAPEQALGRRNEVDARTDLFALGATSFRLLAGRKIHEAPSEAELLMRMASEPAPPIETVVSDLPKSLGMIIDRALAFAKQQRYPDARTMQQDVRAASSGAMPPYASAHAEREQSATRVDLGSPRSGVSKGNAEPASAGGQRMRAPTSVEKNPFARSQRAVAATVVMPGSNAQVNPPATTPAQNVSPTISAEFALAPTVVPPTQDRGLPPAPPSTPNHRTPPIPQTVGEAMHVPLDPTISEPEPLRLPASAIPPGAAPASLAALAKRRRRTLLTGFTLAFVLLVVTTALAIAFIKTRRSTSQAPLWPSPSGATATESFPHGDRSAGSRYPSSPSTAESQAAPGIAAPANGRTPPGKEGDPSPPNIPVEREPRSGSLPGTPGAASASGDPSPPTKASSSTSSTHRTGKTTRASAGKAATAKATTGRKKRVRTQ